MKLIIDISEEEYKMRMLWAKSDSLCSPDTILIAKGVPYEERPQGECKTCRHRDPEDKKCDCGELERQGCLFCVRDDYYCKFYEKGGAE